MANRHVVVVAISGLTIIIINYLLPKSLVFTQVIHLMITPYFLVFCRLVDPSNPYSLCTLEKPVLSAKRYFRPIQYQFEILNALSFSCGTIQIYVYIVL